MKIKHQLLFIAFSFAASLYGGAQDMAYKTPPQAISDIALAQRSPQVSVSDDGHWLLILDRAPFISVAELAQPEYKLAGVRVNGLFGQSRVAGYTSARLLEVKTKQIYSFTGFPPQANIVSAEWSPQSTHVAFTIKTDDGYYLWMASVAGKTAKQVSRRRLNLTLNNGLLWVDETTVVVPVVSANAGQMPEYTGIPSGPVIQESYGEAAPARTYQDLLKNPYDEQLFEYLFTSQLLIVSPGNEKEICPPGIYIQTILSPDKRYILTAAVNKPYPYTTPVYNFPQTTAIYAIDGQLVEEISRRPMLTDQIGHDMASPYPRSYGWRADKPATLYWVEALDEGDSRKTDVPFMDAIYGLDAPFDGGNQFIAKTKQRFQGIQWCDGRFALVREGSRRTRRTKTYAIAPDAPEQPHVLLFDLSTDDKYADPGVPVTVVNRYGWRVIYTDKARSELLMTAQGASPEGDMPYLSRYNMYTGKTTILWQCTAPYYERITDVIDPEKLQFITARQSVIKPVNYYFRDAKSGKSTALTSFPNPYPQLAGMGVTKMKYKRADGLDLTATLYTPPGYDRAKDGRLPVLMWAYPREYVSANDAAQVRGSQYMFTVISYGSPVYWVTRGFAVMDNVEMPIVGGKDVEPNDNFIEQLTMNAEAASQAIHETGVGDTSRMAVGGHSYGAFMTANLLAHTHLFKAGIARSGAYNRTLTPFGFQAEQRTYWEAPEVYIGMSPFNYADQLHGALLLVHGEADNNTGTFPLQSERMFAAVKGHGGVSRFVLLPHESHGYAAKENILHLLYETDAWLEKYVK